LNDRTAPKSRFPGSSKLSFKRLGGLLLIVAAFALMLIGKAETVFVERARVAVTDAAAPVLAVLSRPIDGITAMIETVQELSSLRSENAALRRDNAALRRWQAIARRAQSENRELRSLLNFTPDPPARQVTARVIGDSGGTFVRSVLVSAGAVHGIGRGQAVVTGDGLVGRVAEAGPESSRVLLVTDLNSRIPVRLQSSRHRAILAGDNSDLPQLLYLSPNADARPGEHIVTSGHGGAFPPGIPVGTVVASADGLVRVRPVVDWDRLEYLRLLDFGLRGVLQPEDGAPRIAKR
jgi:rod shape-determining protein MreC